MIPRRLTALKRLRPDNIPNTIPRKQRGTRQLLLRIPRDIAAHHGQAHAEAEALEEAQPQRDQAAPLGRVRQADQQAHAEDADGVGNHHRDAAAVAQPLRAGVAAGQQRQELHGAAGGLQVLRPEGREVEGADGYGGGLGAIRWSF